MAENLDIVIESAQETEPHRSDDHQYEIYVPHPAQQDYRQQDSHDDYDAAHRRHTDLVHSERINLCIALCLGYLLALEILYESLAEPCRDDERQDQRQQGTE